MRAGLFGGTFNPIHYGHLRAVEAVRERAGLDRIIFMPAGNPPLKTSPELADSALRLSMARLATASNGRFEVSDIECGKPGKSYTVDTVASLKESRPGDELFFILGSDAFLELPGWKEPERLISLIDFIVINRPPQDIDDVLSSAFVSGRPAFSEDGICRVGLSGGRAALLVAVPPLDISATRIRELVRAGKSIKYLLPEPVESFIMTHGVYA